jgi:uncharacterized membrane protein
MTRNDAGLEQRVGWLEREVAMLRGDVATLAAAVGHAPAREPEPPPAVEVSSVGEPLGAPAAAVEPVPIATDLAGHREAGSPSRFEQAPGPVSQAGDAEKPDAAPWVFRATPIVKPNAAARAPAAPGPSLERRIGGQVFAIAGALIIIIGLGLAVKVAVENGWFRVLSPGLRCIGIAALGAGMLGVGELLRTRVWPVAIAGFNAVGVAGLYIAAYAAFAVFHLIPAPLAFSMMACAAGVGFGVALRHGFLSTSLLSLVGAYLVPILLSGESAGPLVLPVYVLLLSAVSLALAASRPRPFGLMRDAAWFGSGLLGLLWSASVAAEHPRLVLGFWACAWVLHQAELLVTAARGELRPGVHPERPAPGRLVLRRRVEPVLLAIATTAGVVAIAAVVLRSRLGLDPWLAPAAALAVTSALATTFGGHLRVLRDQPRTDLETLAAAHAAQAGGLLIATVALACSGWVEATAWLAMGVAAVVAGRWTAARSLEVYGLALLSIATVRICTFDLFVGSAGTPWTVGSALVLAPWTVLMIGASASWLLAAWLMLHRGRDEDGVVTQEARPRIAVVCAAVGVGALMFAPAHPQSSAVAVCVAWMLLSILLRGASRVEDRLRLAEMSLVAAVGAIVPWMAGVDVERWLGSAAPIGTHPGAWLGALCVATLIGQAWCSRRWDRPVAGSAFWPALAAIAMGLAFVVSSFEVARGAAMLADDMTARRAAVSIWWGLWGVSLVGAGFWRRVGAVRYVGLALMSVAAFKAVLLDLAGVPQLWRVASFVGLGGLMLGVAVLYGRVSASLAGERAERE